MAGRPSSIPLSGGNGALRVVARRLDADDRWHLSPVEEVRRDGATIRLRPAEIVEARVERNGKPVRGVVAADVHGPLATSDAEGRIFLPPPVATNDHREKVALVADDGWAPWSPEKTPKDARRKEPDADPKAHADEVAHGDAAEEELRDGTRRVELPPDPLLTGRVVEPGGPGIAGALLWQPDHPLIGGQVRTLTARDGGFEIRVPHLPGVGRILFAAAEGFQTLTRPISSDSIRPRQARPLELVLTPRARLEVRIVDEDGLPVTDARVQLQPARWRGGQEFLLRLDSLGVDQDGRVEIRQLSPASRYAARIAAPGFSQRTITFRTPERGEIPEPLEWTLHRARTVLGRVVDDDGAVAGATIRLVEIDRKRTGSYHGRQAESDDDGSFRVDLLSPLLYRLEADADGRGTAVRIVDLREHPAGEPLDLGEISLEEGMELRGRVVDGKGRGVAEISVGAGRFPTTRGHSTRSGEDGRFVLDGIPPETDALEIFAHGENHSMSGRLRLQAPFPEEIEIVVERRLRVSGRVEDRDGEPVPRAAVKVVVKKADGTRATGTATDAEGGFVMRNLPPGEAWVHASASGLGSGETRFSLEPERDVDDVVLVLEPSERILGRVVDEVGDPLPGAEVTCQRRMGGSVRFSGSLHGGLPIVTDAAGIFECDGLGAGSYEIAASARSYARSTVEAELPGQAGEIVLRLEPARVISGVVADADGTPREAVEVRLRDSIDTTDAAGRFRIESGGSEDRPRVRLEAPGGLELVRRLEEGAESDDLHVVFPRGWAVIDGRVLGLGEHALAELRIDAVSFGARGVFRLGALPDAGGRFRLSGLFPGRWTVSAQVGERRRRAEVEIAGPSDHLPVELDFADGREIRGRILLDGEPLREASVHPADGSSSHSTTDHLGRFVLSGVDPGPVTLRIRGSHPHRDAALEREVKVHFVPGREISVELWSKD